MMNQFWNRNRYLWDKVKKAIFQSIWQIIDSLLDLRSDYVDRYSGGGGGRQGDGRITGDGRVEGGKREKKEGGKREIQFIKRCKKCN